MASHSEPAGDDVDWEARYRAGDTPWDKGAAHPALVDRLRERPLSGKILVPGCGLGYDVRAIAASGGQVIGLDIASAAIEEASKYPRVNGEDYILGDLFHPHASWVTLFDWVVEHTCFCAIAPTLRRDYVRQIHRMLKPQGGLLAIFYVNPDTDTGPPYGCPLDELQRLFGPWFDLMEEKTGLRTFDGREDREVLQIWRKKERELPGAS